MDNIKIIVKQDYEYVVNIKLKYINENYLFEIIVKNPPQSFWDNYKKIEGKSLDEALKKAAFELNLAIEQQLAS